jgi:hypothetical protein
VSYAGRDGDLNYGDVVDGSPVGRYKTGEDGLVNEININASAGGYTPINLGSIGTATEIP